MIFEALKLMDGFLCSSVLNQNQGLQGLLIGRRPDDDLHDSNLHVNAELMEID